MSTFNALDVTKPDPASQAGTAFGNAIRDQMKNAFAGGALGSLQSFVYAQSGGTAQYPAVQTLTFGAYIMKRTLTWGSAGGALNNITQAVLSWSDDTGATFVTIATEVRSYDSGGNLTTTTGSGGIMAFLETLWGRFASLLSAFTTHTGTNGTGVHGLGTMSPQNASAVAVTGGAIDGTTLGATTPASVVATTVKETVNNLGNISGATPISWAAGGYQYGTVTGNCTISWTSLPPNGSAQGLTLELTNPGAFTVNWPAGVKWPGGTAPTNTASGIDLLEFSCRDGSTVRGVQAQKNSS